MFNLVLVKKYIQQLPECFLHYVKGLNFVDKRCKDRGYVVEGDECEKIINLYKDSSKRTFFHEVAHTILEDKINFNFVVDYIINNQIIDEFFARAFEEYILDPEKLKNKENVTYVMFKQLQMFINKRLKEDKKIKRGKK